MIMDTLAAISLATEPPVKGELKDEIQKRSDKIIKPVMWRNIIGHAAWQFLILVIMLYSVPYWFGIAYNYVNTSFIGDGIDSTYMTYHYTIIFHTFVLMNLFNQINCRKLSATDLNVFHDFFNNFLFILILAIEFAAQYAIVEFGGSIFRTIPLRWDMHLTCIIFGASSLLIGVALKKTPEAWLVKADALGFREDHDQDEAAKVIGIFAGKLKKSESQRLLDSF